MESLAGGVYSSCDHSDDSSFKKDDSKVLYQVGHLLSQLAQPLFFHAIHLQSFIRLSPYCCELSWGEQAIVGLQVLNQFKNKIFHLQTEWCTTQY